MINEVLNEILQTEKQAEEIIEKARQEAQKIAAECDEECIKMQNDAKHQSKTLREDIANQSEQTAKDEYQKIISENQIVCENMTKEKSALADKAGEYIFGRILDGNC
jgi:vacuolar-type H+-ATPase subunit H